MGLPIAGLLVVEFILEVLLKCPGVGAAIGDVGRIVENIGNSKASDTEYEGSSGCAASSLTWSDPLLQIQPPEPWNQIGCLLVRGHLLKRSWRSS